MYKDLEKKKAWQDAHREQIRERSRNWQKANPERANAAGARFRKKKWLTDPEYRKQKIARERARRARIRLEALAHYGGKCYCCGETELAFLALDHIYGGGNAHRKTVPHIQIWAKQNNWPPILRVACHNCNRASYANGGVCPHQ